MTWVMWITLSSPISTLLLLSTEHTQWKKGWWWCHSVSEFVDTVRSPSGPDCVSHSLRREKQGVNSVWTTYPYLSSSLRISTNLFSSSDRRWVEHFSHLRISSMHPIETWQEWDRKAMTSVMWIALSSQISTLLLLSTEHKQWRTQCWWYHPAFGFDDTVRSPSGPDCVSHSLGREKQGVNSAWTTYPYLSSSLRTSENLSLLIDRRRVEHFAHLRISSMHPIETWQEWDWKAMTQIMLKALPSPISTLLLLSTVHKQWRTD